MKCQILISVKNKKTVSLCRLLKFFPSVLSVKVTKVIVYASNLLGFIHNYGTSIISTVPSFYIG